MGKRIQTRKNTIFDTFINICCVALQILSLPNNLSNYWYSGTQTPYFRLILNQKQLKSVFSYAFFVFNSSIWYDVYKSTLIESLVKKCVF